MGNKPGKAQLQHQLERLLEEQQPAVKTRTLDKFLDSIEKASPWFISTGDLHISDWQEVRGDLQRLLDREGSDSFPLSTFSLWRLVKDALLTDKIHLKQLVQEAKSFFSEIQETKTKESLHLDQSDDDSSSELLLGERGPQVTPDLMPSPPMRGKEGSDMGPDRGRIRSRLYPSPSDYERDYSSESEDLEEERLEKEIAI